LTPYAASSSLNSAGGACFNSPATVGAADNVIGKLFPFLKLRCEIFLSLDEVVRSFREMSGAFDEIPGAFRESTGPDIDSGGA
jgi:hypothetical protein